MRSEKNPHLVGLWCINVRWLLTQSVAVAEKHNPLILTLRPDIRLNPLTPSSRLPHRLQEPPRTALHIGAVVLAHNRLNSFRSLVGIVEWDGGDVVVKDVGFDDAVEDVAAYEAEFAIDGGGGAANVGPAVAKVVGKGRVGVLQEGNRDCRRSVKR